MSDMELISAIITTVVSILGALSIIKLVEHKKNSQYDRYDNNKNMVNIDDNRKYYEEIIYKLQCELLDNERRWKDVNHLIINGQGEKEISLDKMQANLLYSSVFFKNLGIDLEEINIEKKSVFVLTPFSDREAQTFDLIKKVCGDVDLKCSRGDEIYRENNILSHIVTSILQANVVIANINGRNPNVFYELGICHAIGKPVIVITSVKNNLPFDISAKNIVFYKDDKDLQTHLKNELLKIYINAAK